MLALSARLAALPEAPRRTDRRPLPRAGQRRLLARPVRRPLPAAPAARGVAQHRRARGQARRPAAAPGTGCGRPRFRRQKRNCSRTTPQLQVVVRDDGLAAAHELSSYPLAPQLRRHPAPLPRALPRQDRRRADRAQSAKASPRRTTSSASSTRSAPRTSFPTPCRARCGSTRSTASRSPPTTQDQRGHPALRASRHRQDAGARPVPPRPSRWQCAGWPGAASPPASTWRCPVATASSAATCWPTAAFPAASARRSTCRQPARSTLEDGVLGGSVRLAASIPA